MKPKLTLLTALLLAPLALAHQPAAITVHADKPGAPVPRSLHGIFFEEVNHAGDGGLYAELINNRSFDATLPIEGCTLVDGKCKATSSPCYFTGKIKNWSRPWQFASPWPAWSLGKPQGVAVAMSIETEKPLKPSNTTYLRLTLPALPDGEAVRLLNEGYWGIGIRDGESYDFSFFARQGTPSIAKVRVGVMGADGRVLSEREVALDSSDWKQYSGSLAAQGTDAKAKFFLQPLTPGSLDLDFVSLFPRKTYKNRPNGMRADLAQFLADLKPAFLRFPGGCVVEGVTMENRVQWKKTIGLPHERSGHYSMWGYRSTDGLGHHELLQLAEDLGADAMWVVNVGLSCVGSNGDYYPDERVPELIQDTLDGIEYALGSPDTKWGRLRAEAGHPAPFPLRYIELGAENYGPLYKARYRQFADAIRKEYPQLTLISSDKVDDSAALWDEHFYNVPSFFFEGHTRYDAQSRTNTQRRYIGEFAVYKNVGTGNLLAALAEAAFMMGFERNADLVTMCSYAPLFFNIHKISWPVNMIGFDSGGSFARTSYYAQQILAGNLPDVNVACETVSPTPLGALPVQPSAGIGLMTEDSQAEFKDVKVTDSDGKVLFESDWSKKLGGFTAGAGQWSIVDDTLRQTGDRGVTGACVGLPLPGHFTLSLRARKLSGKAFWICFDANKALEPKTWNNWWKLGGWGNRKHGLEGPGLKVPVVDGQIETGRWYDIRIEVVSERVRCFLDGALIHDAGRYDNLPSLYAVAGTTKSSGELILKVVNAAEKPQSVRIKVKGIPSLLTSATLISMSHPDRTAENSLAEPTKIVPLQRTVEVSSDFTQTFPANSVNVLRMQTAGQ